MEIAFSSNVSITVISHERITWLSQYMELREYLGVSQCT